VITPQRRILVTGSRHWRDTSPVHAGLRQALGQIYSKAQLNPILFNWSAVTLVHGGAHGLDTIAARVAVEWGMTVEPHKAEWHRYGRRAGHVRNHRMVTAGADICVAWPKGESVGTRDCMRLAAAAGIPVLNLGDSAGEDALIQ
jgi:hypothetical protein